MVNGICYVVDLNLGGLLKDYKKIIFLLLGGRIGVIELYEVIKYVIVKGCFVIVVVGNLGYK